MTFRALALLLLCAAAHGERAGEEILYPSKAYAKLDTFEAINLEDADKLYGKRDYTGAYAAYEAYSFEFAKSPALHYVLLRMGRCLHSIGKRNAAIKGYQDVVDYFPDDVRHAAAALYYMGQCHQQNWDVQFPCDIGRTEKGRARSPFRAARAGTAKHAGSRTNRHGLAWPWLHRQGRAPV